METTLSGFETIEAWKEGRKSRRMMIRLCKQLSNEEKLRLIDQVKRSSRSVTANIAEGYGRFHYTTLTTLTLLTSYASHYFFH